MKWRCSSNVLFCLSCLFGHNYRENCLRTRMLNKPTSCVSCARCKLLSLTQRVIMSKSVCCVAVCCHLQTVIINDWPQSMFFSSFDITREMLHSTWQFLLWFARAVSVLRTFVSSYQTTRDICFKFLHNSRYSLWHTVSSGNETCQERVPAWKTGYPNVSRGFIQSHRQAPWWCFKIGHDSFVPHSF